MERYILGIDEAERAMLGATVEGFEFIQGETEDEDYIVLHFPGDVTLYASAPTVYANAPTE